MSTLHWNYQWVPLAVLGSWSVVDRAPLTTVEMWRHQTLYTTSQSPVGSPPAPVWIITLSDPIGPHRTTPHSTSYFLPPTQSLILSLTYTLQTRLIIDVRDLNTIVTKHTRCSYQRYAPTAQSSDIVSRYEQKRPALSALNYRVNCRLSALSRLEFNWHCRQRRRATGQYIWNEFWHVCLYIQMHQKLHLDEWASDATYNLP